MHYAVCCRYKSVDSGWFFCGDSLGRGFTGNGQNVLPADRSGEKKNLHLYCIDFQSEEALGVGNVINLYTYGTK